MPCRKQLVVPGPAANAETANDKYFLIKGNFTGAGFQFIEKNQYRSRNMLHNPLFMIANVENEDAFLVFFVSYIPVNVCRQCIEPCWSKERLICKRNNKDNNDHYSKNDPESICTSLRGSLIWFLFHSTYKLISLRYLLRKDEENCNFI